MLRTKKLLFKLGQFPVLSETFVVSQIVTAIKCGFDVKILVNQLLDIENSKQLKNFQLYNLQDKIITEDFGIPNKKFHRYLKALLLLLKNLKDLKVLFSYLNHKNEFDVTLIFKFNFFKKFRNFDLIHVQFGNNHQPFEILKKIGFIDSKILVSFHGHDAFYPIHGFIPMGYYDNLFKYGDFMIANTPYLAEQIKLLGCKEEKIKIIPIGYNDEIFNNTSTVIENSDKTIQIITVGRLDKIKGHIYAIKVIELLMRKKLPIRFTIVGEGEERETIENYIKINKLQNVVELLGAKSQLEIKEFFLKSHIYLFCPIPIEMGRQETQGLATLEAQACGLPVLAFDSGGVKYTILENKTGYVIPTLDIDKMADKLEILVKEKDLREKMGKEASDFVRDNFSMKITDHKWCNLYRQLTT